MQTQFTVIDELRIRYASRSGKHDENLFLLSPLPESIFAFEPMWDSLAEQFNLIAIDLPGYGQSESRQDLFSAKAMAEFVVKAIDHFTFNTPHILGPDIGTPVALFVAAKYPNKIRSLIIGGGACVYPLLVDNVLKEILDAPDLELFRKIPVKDIIGNSLSELKQYVLPEEIRADYIVSYEGNRLIDAMQILRNYKSDVPELDKYLDKIENPVQIIWGEKDPIALAENARILHKRLPKNKLNILKDAGHYTWEEHWEDYLAITSAWLNGGYSKAT